MKKLITLIISALIITTASMTCFAGEAAEEAVATEQTESASVEETTAEAKPKTPAKKNNTMKVTGKTLMFSADFLKTDKIKYEFFKVTKAKGKVTYKKLSGSKKFTINRKSGKVTIKKKTKRGAYKLRFRITAAGNSKYKAKTVTKKIKVKII